MKYTVNMPEECSAYVERLQYEYNSTLSILRYLTAQEDTLEKYLERYETKASDTLAELEMAKAKVSKQYLPKELAGKKYTYQIFFDTCTVVYEEE